MEGKNMKLTLEHVTEKFYLYSGEDPAETGQRAGLCAQLCEECADRVNALLEKRREQDAEGLASGERYLVALESWAAAEAFYQLALRDRAVSPEVVTADGVRVDAKERAEHAAALAKEKRGAACLLLGEEGFCFERV